VALKAGKIPEKNGPALPADAVVRE
jgi:hypothetical protein